MLISMYICPESSLAELRLETSIHQYIFYMWIRRIRGKCQKGINLLTMNHIHSALSSILQI